MESVIIKPITVELPDGVQAEIADASIRVKGPKGELSREFYYPGISVKAEGNKIIFSTELETKKAKAVIGAFGSHVANMAKGVSGGFAHELKIVFSHFPMTVKQAGEILEIHNFLGEKAPRKAKVVGDSKVQIEKDRIVVEGISKEDVAQTAANLETATRVRRRDIRVFQDGIYITKKEELAGEQ